MKDYDRNITKIRININTKMFVNKDNDILGLLIRKFEFHNFLFSSSCRIHDKVKFKWYIGINTEKKKDQICNLKEMFGQYEEI